MSLTYREDFKAWWPDYDHSPEKCFQFVQKGLGDMNAAAKLTPRRRLAIQAGGHAGFWPKRLRMIFDRVITFEPEPILFECMKRNLKDIDVEMYPFALSSFNGTAKLRPHVSAGSWRIDEVEGTVPVETRTIDSLNVPHCDVIYLDIEGYEVEALKGAMETIDRFQPILHVEELPRSKVGIQEFMKSIGYKPRAQVHNDVVYRYS